MPKSVAGRLDTQVTPEPTLEKPIRRTSNAEDKLRMIAEAQACQHGELGALLRREKLYSHQLFDCGREFADNEVAGLRKRAPGPAAARTPNQRRIAQLEKEKRRLNRKLAMAHDCLDLQKSLVAARSPEQSER